MGNILRPVTFGFSCKPGPVLGTAALAKASWSASGDPPATRYHRMKIGNSCRGPVVNSQRPCSPGGPGGCQLSRPSFGAEDRQWR